MLGRVSTYSVDGVADGAGEIARLRPKSFFSHFCDFGPDPVDVAATRILVAKKRCCCGSKTMLPLLLPSQPARFASYSVLLSSKSPSYLIRAVVSGPYLPRRFSCVGPETFRFACPSAAPLLCRIPLVLVYEVSLKPCLLSFTPLSPSIALPHCHLPAHPHSPRTAGYT